MAPHDRFVLEVPVEPADEVVRFTRRRWSHGEKLREPAGGAALAHVSIAPALASRRAREELAGICGSIDRFHFELNAVRTFAGGIVLPT